METTSMSSPYDKPKIRGMNQYYYIPNGDDWLVMRRYKSVPDKPAKSYKTQRGASNHTFHMNRI